MQATKREDSKAYKRALYRHTTAGPEMNFYALVFSEALDDPERMKLVVEFSEVIWAHDDTTDESSMGVAVSESERLRRSMYDEYSDDPLFDGETSFRVRHFREICGKVRTLYPEFWPEVRDAMAEWLMTEKEAKSQWNTVEDYLKFRKVHCGNNIVAALARWAANINLTKEELASVKEFQDAAGVWYGLANDLLSWKRERLQPSDRILNTVALFMKQYNLPEKVSVDVVRGLVVEQEEKILGMGNELRRKAGVSRAALEYVDIIEHYAGGVFYWYLLAPRNTKPQ